MTKRVQKVAEALKREISTIIHGGLKDPRIGFVTVLRIDLTADLKLARVHFSILGSKKAQSDSLEGLERAKGFMKRCLGQRLDMRYMPDLIFVQDKSIEYSMHIEEKLRKIKDESKKKRSKID